MKIEIVQFKDKTYGIRQTNSIFSFLRMEPRHMFLKLNPDDMCWLPMVPRNLTKLRHNNLEFVMLVRDRYFDELNRRKLAVIAAGDLGTVVIQ